MKDYLPICPAPVSEPTARQYPSLTLAYLGDGVHTLWVRTRMLADGPCKVGQIHETVCAQVCASAQAKALAAVVDILSESESDVVRRARNAHVNTVAKHASLADYKSATAFEALIGYLYLIGAHERLSQVLACADAAPQA